VEELERAFKARIEELENQYKELVGE